MNTPSENKKIAKEGRLFKKIGSAADYCRYVFIPQLLLVIPILALNIPLMKTISGKIFLLFGIYIVAHFFFVVFPKRSYSGATLLLNFTGIILSFAGVCFFYGEAPEAFYYLATAVLLLPLFFSICRPEIALTTNFIIVIAVLSFFKIEEVKENRVILFLNALTLTFPCIWCALLESMQCMKRLREKSLKERPIFTFQETYKERGQREKLIKISKNLLLERLRSSAIWKIVATVCIAAITTFGVAVLRGEDSLLFLLLWSVITLTHLLILNLILKTKRLHNLCTLLVILLIVGINWWLIGQYLGFYDDISGIVVLSALIFMYGSVALPFKWYAYFFLAALLYAAGAAVEGDTFLSFCIFAATFLVMFRNAFVNYLEIYTDVSTIVLTRGGEVGVAGRSLIRVLAWQLCVALNVKHVLICSKNLIEAVFDNSAKILETDSNLNKTLFEVAQDESGLIYEQDIDQSVKGIYKKFFKFKPAAVAFERFRVTNKDQEEQIVLLVPMGEIAAIIGFERAFKTVHLLSAIVRIALSATRLRRLSSNATVDSQRFALEKDREMNLAVHFVNNLVQDVVIQCEDLKRKIEGVKVKKEAISEDTLQEIAQAVTQIECYSRMLSNHITDLKLLKEMKAIRIFERKEKSGVAVVLEEFSEYVRSSALRYGYSCEIDLQIKTDAAFIVSAGQEFVSTALRAIFYVIASSLNRGKKIHLIVSAQEEQIDFKFLYSGEAISLSQLEDTSCFGKDEKEWRKIEYLSAVSSFAKVSEGSFEALSAEAPYTNGISLKLPFLAEEKAEIIGSGWALLVDDNPQVLTFYARAAQALNLEYQMAHSKLEAVNIIEENGTPAIVISDLRLESAESGFELIKHIREFCGANVPILVVSGTTDREYVKKALAYGADAYLTKPLGRKKLFSEISANLKKSLEKKNEC